MKRLILAAVMAFAAAGPAAPQSGPADMTTRRMPDGRTQAEVVLQHEHRQALEEAAELLKLAEELKADLEKNTHHILSLDSIRTTEEIEKLAKKIRKRLKRY